jgi:uncharacterized LabA/DUF88 family protein
MSNPTYDALGLPVNAEPVREIGPVDEVVPIEDPQGAKAAALRAQRRESVESRGVEPLDDRVHGAEIPTISEFGEGDRHRRGGRGRRNRDEGREGGRRGRHDRRDRRRDEVPMEGGFDAPPPRPMDLEGDMGGRPRGARPLPGPSYERGLAEGMIEPTPGGIVPGGMGGQYGAPPAQGGYASAPGFASSPAMSSYGTSGGSDVTGLRREIEDLKAQLNRSLMPGAPAGASSAYGAGEGFAPRVPAPPGAAPVAPPAMGSSAMFAAQRVAILADVPSLQRTAKKTFGRFVSFAKLLNAVIRGRGAVRAIAFLGDRDANDPAFLQHLRQTGFEVRRIDAIPSAMHRADAAGSLSLEATRLANRVDVLVLAGCDPELYPLIPALRAQGCRVELASFPDAGVDPARDSADGYISLSREELI